MTQAPSVEERLAAAAYAILTDHYDHSLDAQRWAVRFLRRSARGRPTAFQRHVRESDERAPSRREH